MVMSYVCLVLWVTSPLILFLCFTLWLVIMEKNAKIDKLEEKLKNTKDAHEKLNSAIWDNKKYD